MSLGLWSPLPIPELVQLNFELTPQIPASIDTVEAVA